MNRNLTAVVLIIIAVGAYFTVTEGVFKEARSIQAVNKKYVDALKDAENLIKLRDELSNKLDNLPSTDKIRLEKMLPRSVDNIRLIIDLNSIAIRHGFPLQNVKAATSDSSDQGSGTGRFQSPPPMIADSGLMDPAMGNPMGTIAEVAIPVPALDTIDVSFSVKATYQKFIEFLNDIESNLRLMDVTNISLKTADDGSYEWSVDLRTYWMRNP